MTDLNSLIDPASEVSVYDTLAINDQGQIIGDGFIDGRSGILEALLLTPIPEPSSSGIASFATLGATALLRRRCRKANPGRVTHGAQGGRVLA